ncbi:hypothetical protein HY993_03520 [Candidatus Micrarchaeota archaeon]|nr:hypothetical protein [Candidatus Micrarchaeota archaeon]
MDDNLVVKLFLPGVFVFALLFIAGCIADAPEPLFDCKSDLNCFQNQTGVSCGPANVSTTKQEVSTGALFSVNSEVRPSSLPDECNLMVKITGFELAEGTPPQLKQELEKARLSLSALRMDCGIAKGDSGNLTDANYFTSEQLLSNCDGVLKAVLKKIRGLGNQTAPGPNFAASPTITPAPTATTVPTLASTPSSTAGPTGAANSVYSTYHSIGTGAEAGKTYYYKIISTNYTHYAETAISTFTMPN